MYKIRKCRGAKIKLVTFHFLKIYFSILCLFYKHIILYFDSRILLEWRVIYIPANDYREELCLQSTPLLNCTDHRLNLQALLSTLKHQKHMVTTMGLLYINRSSSGIVYCTQMYAVSPVFTVVEPQQNTKLFRWEISYFL